MVHDEDALLFLINQMGHEKIALGSDYPFPLGEIKPGKLIESINISLNENIISDINLVHENNPNPAP